MYSIISEADEAAEGNKELALKNLEYQVVNKEPIGIISLYEIAALNCGATLSETEAIIIKGRQSC